MVVNAPEPLVGSLEEKLGVEQDDQVELEFVSPVTPNQLKIIRAPAPEKKAKGGGKKGKAAGKKKK